MLKNQKGFTVLEIILAILVVLALGAAAYSVYQVRYNQSNESAQKSNPPATSSTSAPSSSSEISNEDAVSLVNGFYKAYLAAVSAGSTDQENQVVANYGTSKFVQAYKSAQDYDPVLCAQNTVQSVTVKSKSTSSTEAVVMVERADYSGQIFVHVVQSGDKSLKINQLDCPAQ